MVRDNGSNKRPAVTSSPPLSRSDALRVRKDHPCVNFILEVFNRCVRLWCYEDFNELIPEDFGPYRPQEPKFHFKYGDKEKRE